jgi:hypothetical protein
MYTKMFLPGLLAIVATSVAASDAPIRLASLTVVKQPPPARYQMRVSTRPDETVIDYPTAESKGRVLLAVDNCLRWGEQCGQPAADEVCRRYAPDRPVATRFTLMPNAGATVVMSSGDHCWADYCVGLTQVHCVAKPSRVTGGIADARISGAAVQSSSAVAAPAVVAAPAAGSAAVIAAPATDPNACKTGFVWREARAEDLVCVTPESRQRTANENAVAASRVDPNGAYGPATCISGFVWREAFDGDTVCVTPETRDLVRAENEAGASRRAGN